MFNRELKDLEFIPRWQIVRKVRTQYLAGHSFLVAMYVNDLCDMLGIDDATRLASLQWALWHDVDEIFSGDMPGPAKRALVSDPVGFKDKLRGMMNRVFGSYWILRSGRSSGHRGGNEIVVQLLVKTADWLEAAFEMATEIQLGNRNCEHHLQHDLDNAKRTANALISALRCDPAKTDNLRHRVNEAFEDAVRSHRDYVSEGPLADPEERAIAVRLGLIRPTP